jgi:hypothetical protein
MLGLYNCAGCGECIENEYGDDSEIARCIRCGHRICSICAESSETDCGCGIHIDDEEFDITPVSELPDNGFVEDDMELPDYFEEDEYAMFDNYEDDEEEDGDEDEEEYVDEYGNKSEDYVDDMDGDGDGDINTRQ